MQKCKRQKMQKTGKLQKKIYFSKKTFFREANRLFCIIVFYAKLANDNHPTPFSPSIITSRAKNGNLLASMPNNHHLAPNNSWPEQKNSVYYQAIEAFPVVMRSPWNVIRRMSVKEMKRQPKSDAFTQCESNK